MTDINDLMQEFWSTSSDRAVTVGASFFAMRRLLEILQRCFHILEVTVCFFIFILLSYPFLRLPSTFADNTLNLPAYGPVGPIRPNPKI